MSYTSTYLTTNQIAKLESLGVKTQEAHGHFVLKTNERGRDKMHCRAVVEIAVKLGKEKLLEIAKEYGYKNVNDLLMAATGRPEKSRRNGRSQGAETYAFAMATGILDVMAEKANIERPKVFYGHYNEFAKEAPETKPAEDTKTAPKKTVAKRTSSRKPAKKPVEAAKTEAETKEAAA